MASRRRQPLDGAYKLLFSHKAVVSDLIRGYVDPESAAGLDLATLERCNGSYVSMDLRERRNDVVWRARARQGWIYVYLLIEFQSTIDRYMAVRLLTYVGLLWQDLIAQKQTTTDGLLPPVLPIVLYNGDQAWTAPVELQSLLAPAPAFLMQFQPQSRYLFLDETRAATAKELGLRNLAAAVFALEQTSNLAAHDRVLKALRIWLRNRPDLKEAFGTWYAEAIAPTGLLTVPHGITVSLDKVEAMMATRILKDIERQKAASSIAGHAEGHAKGHAKGQAEGRAEGHAKGRAEGLAVAIETIYRLVRTGALSAPDARAQVRLMLKSREISRDVARAALARLK